MKEGAFRIEIDAAGPVVRVTGGGIPGVIYGVEELIAHGGSDPSAGRGGAARGFAGHALPDLLDLGPLDQLGAVAGRRTRRSASSTPTASRPAASSPTTSGWSTSAAGTASRRSPSTASCAIPTAASRRRRSSAATPRSAACGSCRASPSAPMAASTGRATTSYNLATWLRQNPQYAATMEKGVGFQTRRPCLPAQLPALRLHRHRLPERAGDDGVDGGGRRLARRDLRDRRHQHRERRLRRLRLRALRRAPGQCRGGGAAEGRPRRFVVAHRHGRELPAPLQGGQGEEAGPLGLLRDAVGQPARPGGPRGAGPAAAAAASTSTPPTAASGAGSAPS